MQIVNAYPYSLIFNSSDSVVIRQNYRPNLLTLGVLLMVSGLQLLGVCPAWKLVK